MCKYTCNSASTSPQHTRAIGNHYHLVKTTVHIDSIGVNILKKFKIIPYLFYKLPATILFLCKSMETTKEKLHICKVMQLLYLQNE